ncbi:hypothetical protein C8F01DRAFT_1145537 [Mycena amicta]|nr:hypothetical protein C8F01DRAFT_1145537 [Mycena amicta]
MMSLPGELVDLILDFTAVASRSSLPSCSLVSRQWVPRSRHYSFDSVHLIRDHGKDNVKPFLQLLSSLHVTIASSIRCVHIHHRPSYGTPVLSAGDILARVIRYRVRPWRVVLDCHFAQASMPSNLEEDMSSIMHLDLTLYGVVPLHDVFTYLATFPELVSLGLRTQDWRSEHAQIQWLPEQANLDLLPHALHELEVHQYSRSLLRHFGDLEALQKRFTSLVLYNISFGASPDLNSFLNGGAGASVTSLTLDEPDSVGVAWIALDRLSALKHLHLRKRAAIALTVITHIVERLVSSDNRSQHHHLETIDLVLDESVTANFRPAVLRELERCLADSLPRLKQLLLAHGVENPLERPLRRHSLAAEMQTKIRSHMPLCAQRGILVFY